MIKHLCRLLKCTRAAAAIEAGVVAPLFLIMTIGVTDLGTLMFEQMAVNAAAQAGAAYAVKHALSTASPSCQTLTSGCLTGIQTAVSDGAGGLSISASPAPTIASCVDGSPTCIVVSASSTFSPILTKAAYSWATSFNLSSTVTIRIQ